MIWFYNILLTLFAPLWVPWMLWRTWRRKEKPNWKERQGDFGESLPPRRESGPRVWVHTVSVGEFVAAKPLLRELRRALPEHEIVVSVTTSSGHQTAREAGEDLPLFDHLVYFPLDIARFQLSAMQRVSPDAVVVVETELWMNFLWAAKVFDARTMLVNGRISDRSFPRSQKVTFFYRALLAQLDRCLMQSETDAERIRTLGARDAEMLGNIKFDQALEGLDADPEFWRRELGLSPSMPVVVVGSLRYEEFLAVGPALAEMAAGFVQVVVAPRHLERTEELVKALGGKANRRSEGQRIADGLLVLDTYGELAQVYSVADVAVVGGGFAALGGQNIIQPLALGKPVVHGPYMRNFRDVAALAQSAGATAVCESPADLDRVVSRLLRDDALRQRMGEAARELVARNVGASRRYAEAVADEIRRHPIPQPRTRRNPS